jgi:hypothetical protein
MRLGTKSVLYGAHQFLIHPLFVAWAWTQLYGWPYDPRLWLCFFVHDLGYIGKPNMDGPQGELHPELGGKIMSLFGSHWRDMSLGHSRFYAALKQISRSPLFYADKLAVTLEPAWLYLWRVRATGEIYEYMAGAKDRYADMQISTTDIETWHESCMQAMRKLARGERGA